MTQISSLNLSAVRHKLEGIRHELGGIIHELRQFQDRNLSRIKWVF